MMRLQVNLSGSWRDVIHFEDTELDRKVIAILARRLLALASRRCSMRIADDKNVQVEYLGEAKP